MRKLFIVDHAFPPTEDDLTAAANAGATEVVCGIPPALAALGVTTFGYHEEPEPQPLVPEVIEMRKAKLEMLATPWPDGNGGTTTLLDVVDAAVAAGSRALQIEYAGNELGRHRDLVLGVQAQLSISDATMDAMFLAAAARP